MDGVLIYRSLSPAELKEIADLRAQGAALFVNSSQAQQRGIKQLEAAPIQLSAINMDQISQELIQTVLAFGDSEVNGKSCKEHLQMETTSIWYYHKYRIFLEMRQLKTKIAEINEYASSYDKLHVYSTSLGEAKTEANVKLSVSSAQKNELNKLTLIKYAYVFFRRAVSGFFQLMMIVPAYKNLIISNPKVEVPYLSRNSFEKEHDDLYLGYFLQKVDDSFLFLDDLTPPKFSSPSGFEVRSRYLSNPRNRPQLNTDYLMLRALFSPGVHRKMRKIKKQLKESYKLLEQNITDDVQLDIVSRVKRLNSTSLYLAFKFYALQRFFKKRKFKTLTAQDENNTSTKVILDAAKSNQVTTIGIQHGAISKLHMGYLFTKKDYEFGGLTDLTLVWGEYWKSVLIEYGNYNPEQVICTGQIRTDIIADLKQHIADGQGGQDGKQQIVVFATQLQPDVGLMKRAAEDAFKAIKDLKNVTLLLKLHPRENDPNYYHDIAKQIGCTNYLIDQDSDLYTVLASCDVLMTCYSTVGGEGVYFDKPLIILDYLKQDYCGYLQEGVALQATSGEELKTYITGFLSGKLKISPGVYDDFKTNYAYKIDGKVSERCLEIIKSVKPNN